MSLSSSVTDLATRIASYIKTSVMPRLLPAGGATGQVLAKSSAADYSVSWVQGWTSANFNPDLYAKKSGETFTGALLIRPPFISTQFATYLDLAPSDLGDGKNSFFITKASSTKEWMIGLYDAAAGYSGDLGFFATTLKFNGQSIWYNGNQSLANSTNGYCKLPNGLIVQWGTLPAGSPADATITFPIQFTSTCFGVQATADTTDTSGAFASYTSSITTSNFVVRRRKVASMALTSDTTAATRWFAVGI